MNNFIKARPAQKHPVKTAEEANPQDTSKSLNKVEGIIISPIKLKELREGQSYFWAFFQLEGIEQDIPVIFKINTCPRLAIPHEECQACPWKDEVKAKPKIPLRAKVLLEGKWAESNHSTRPSFTCVIYEILADPPPITIKSLREQINSLLDTSKDKKAEWTQRTDQLFKKLETLKDLEKTSKLGSKYLAAYLLLKSAHYANYQDNLLPHTGNLVYQEEYLAKISSEIEEIAHHIRAYEAKEI